MSGNRLNIRITCDPFMTEAVIVIGDGPNAISIGIPVEDVPRLIEEANIARNLVLHERQRAGAVS